jgi:hypothetical protein
VKSIPVLKASCLLGTAGRPRAAHVVKLGPVGVESPGKKLAEKGTPLAQGARPPVALAGRCAKGTRRDGRHDESCRFSGVF